MDNEDTLKAIGLGTVILDMRLPNGKTKRCNLCVPKLLQFTKPSQAGNYLLPSLQVAATLNHQSKLINNWLVDNRMKLNAVLFTSSKVTSFIA